MKENIITQDEADRMLIETLHSPDFEDRVHEFAMECFRRGIEKVEKSTQHIARPTDGNATMWYDGIQKDFFAEFYKCLYDFLRPNYDSGDDN